MTWYQAWLLTDTVKNSRFLLMGIFFLQGNAGTIGKQKTGGEINQWIFGKMYQLKRNYSYDCVSHLLILHLPVR